MKTHFPLLLGPARIGTREVKNRIIMTGMSAHMAPDAGWVTDREVAFYDRRAKGGPGCIVVGAAFVHPSGTFGAQLGIHSDMMIPGLARLASVIKAQGALASIQLHHAGRQTSSCVTGCELIAPSAIACPVKQELPRPLSLADIEEVLGWYAEGARRALEAGFDGVEVHGAHGYLPAQFLSPRANRRNDDYGGSLENRTRFVCAVLSRVRDVVGSSAPLTVKISGDEYAQDGLTLTETPKIVQHLAGAGADLVTVSAGAAPYYHTVPGMALEAGCFVPAARAIKRVSEIPVSAVGRITTPAQAESILAEGDADFISVGRALIADPDWASKAATGASDDICVCIGCNKGCHDPTRAERATACLLNAEAGFELELGVSPADRSLRVLVIGGGPGGLEAARVARLRGHAVTLCERETFWGGRLRLGTVPPHKQDYQLGIDYLVTQCRKSGVDMRLSTNITLDQVKAMAPQVVVLASGAQPAWPALPGLNEDGRSGETSESPITTLSADEVLAGRPVPGERVMLVGGGAVGAEVAHELGDRGHAVTVLHRRETWGDGMPPDAQWHIAQAVADLPVDFRLGTEVTAVRGDKVRVSDAGGSLELEAGGTLVVAAGAVPNRALAQGVAQLGLPLEIIGDACSPRSALEAVAEGYRAASRIGSAQVGAAPDRR